MLELRGAAPGLLDDPLLLEVGGAPPGSSLTWRARLRDDDGFVWRATGPSPDALTWAPAKPAAAGALAALRSLRPIDLDIRVEDATGAGATRTLTRTLLADGVKARRWKDGVGGTLYLPAEATGAGAILVGATLAAGAPASGTPLAAAPSESGTEPPPAEPAPARADVLPLAAALLASRGVLVFALARGTAEAAREALGAVPSAPAEIVVLDDVPLPPGVPARVPGDTARWDALLAELRARPRRVAR